MTLVDAWRVFMACLLVWLVLAVIGGIVPEVVRIRQALERAWPSNQQIDSVLTR